MQPPESLTFLKCFIPIIKTVDVKILYLCFNKNMSIARRGRVAFDSISYCKGMNCRMHCTGYFCIIYHSRYGFMVCFFRDYRRKSRDSLRDFFQNIIEQRRVVAIIEQKNEVETAEFILQLSHKAAIRQIVDQQNMGSSLIFWPEKGQRPKLQGGFTLRGKAGRKKSKTCLKKIESLLSLTYTRTACFMKYRMQNDALECSSHMHFDNKQSL